MAALQRLVHTLLVVDGGYWVYQRDVRKHLSMFDSWILEGRAGGGKRVVEGGNGDGSAFGKGGNAGGDSGAGGGNGGGGGGDDVPYGGAFGKVVLGR